MLTSANLHLQRVHQRNAGHHRRETQILGLQGFNLASDESAEAFDDELDGEMTVEYLKSIGLETPGGHRLVCGVIQYDGKEGGASPGGENREKEREREEEEGERKKRKDNDWVEMEVEIVVDLDAAPQPPAAGSALPPPEAQFPAAAAAAASGSAPSLGVHPPAAAAAAAAAAPLPRSCFLWKHNAQG
uniref:Uncharacterized protein n=1 Tax=Chromera velia CCMP2878 TaxID=1169474 RepID=A0A0G4HA03_9ALVE|eukprot:Cvel_6041.t1-p1 / transcript=Cvel_6041.t1 / gene=Cvel_6041 / organism=Chromera_velia_CCMP2878 / gene_product=hypothetical protein / transcript_product=hypothetical protein / location=Cvel_scaffold290:34397-40048(+) / protein_length=187 / sequence_SO=supercontig / SO=protein_coding / is_pseudo=false